MIQGPRPSRRSRASTRAGVAFDVVGVAVLGVGHAQDALTNISQNRGVIDPVGALGTSARNNPAGPAQTGLAGG